MEIKLFDSELKVMDVLWKQGDAPAREIARVLTDELGWNVNTTYTLIKRCMEKGRDRAERAGVFLPCPDPEVCRAGGRDGRTDQQGL